MGDLEDRTRRLEEVAELQEARKRRESERVLQEVLRRLSTAELEAMAEAFGRDGPEDWTEEDEPLMRRLLTLMHEIRNEEAEEFSWKREMDERKERRRDD